MIKSAILYSALIFAKQGRKRLEPIKEFSEVFFGRMSVHDHFFASPLSRYEEEANYEVRVDVHDTS